MINMLYVLLYFIVGIVMIFGTATIHVIRAMCKGYLVVEYWEEHMDEFHAGATKLDYVIGLIVWPIRYIRFLCYIPELYKQYELNN